MEHASGSLRACISRINREIVLLIHWAGGRHSELRLKKRETGQHRRCTSMEAVEVVRQMAGRFTDEAIAVTLNRLGMRTGIGNTWDKNLCGTTIRSPTSIPSSPAAKSR